MEALSETDRQVKAQQTSEIIQNQVWQRYYDEYHRNEWIPITTYHTKPWVERLSLLDRGGRLWQRIRNWFRAARRPAGGGVIR